MGRFDGLERAIRIAMALAKLQSDRTENLPRMAGACAAGQRRSSVTLDQVIETMRQTGADMSSKYRETARGGLAINVPEC
jgi:L-serine deaminase